MTIEKQPRVKQGDTEVKALLQTYGGEPKQQTKCTHQNHVQQELIVESEAFFFTQQFSKCSLTIKFG